MQFSDVLSSDPEVVSGAVVFKGTRVPVEALFENLRSGMSLEEFFENYPTVERAQVDAVLALASQDIEQKISRAA
ncbi:DUF433 domain-containing protein [Aquibium carbonis]|uniref:DUF433 domain-containing protein n=1 Tax=Aquibium carbonis TaxID=2495581 RepID=A0A3S0ARC0_9HYPH|nr:DUF433 domain-containing protein [Aquibium carbonis]RST85249.1 DUF433 domain-containing protein [Aquibium carbonis]